MCCVLCNINRTKTGLGLASDIGHCLYYVFALSHITGTGLQAEVPLPQWISDLRGSFLFGRCRWVGYTTAIDSLRIHIERAYFTEEESKYTSDIGRLRIYIERAFACVKQFQIFAKTLKITQSDLAV